MTIEGPQSQSFQICGFLRSPDSTFTAFEAPAAPVGTDPCCISPSGTIAGLSSEYDNTSGNYISHGFLRGADGTLTAFDFPIAGVNTGVTSMNPQGAVLGSYNAGNQSHPYWDLRPHDTHGYVRAPDSTFTTFDAPGANTTYRGYLVTAPTSINLADAVTGWYYSDANCVQHGFLRRGV